MQSVFFEIVLSSQLQIHIHPPVFHHIKGLAVFLIIVSLRDGRAPVDHKMLKSILRHPGTADIVVLRVLLRVKLQRHPRKVRRLQEPLHPCELLPGRLLLDIVLVDRVAHGLKLDISLHRVRIAVKVQRQVAPDILLLLRGLLRDGLDLLLQLILHHAQFPVGHRQVRLLLFKYLFLCSVLFVHSSLRFSEMIVSGDGSAFWAPAAVPERLVHNI